MNIYWFPYKPRRGDMMVARGKEFTTPPRDRMRSI